MDASDIRHERQPSQGKQAKSSSDALGRSTPVNASTAAIDPSASPSPQRRPTHAAVTADSNDDPVIPESVLMHRPSMRPQDDLDADIILKPLSIEQNDDEDELSRDMLFASVTNIESLPAYKVIESMRKRKELPPKRVAELKAKLSAIHTILLRSLEIEKSLFRTCRKISSEIKSQINEVDVQHERRFQYSVEVGELRREVTRAETESRMVVARDAAFEREIDELTKARDDIQHDVDEIQNHGKDKLAPQLLTSIRELKVEIVQSRPQVDALQRDVTEKQKSLTEAQQERAKVETDKERHLSDVAKMSELPIKHKKQSDTFKETLAALAMDISQLSMVFSELDRTEKEVSAQRQKLQEESNHLRSKLDASNKNIIETERQRDNSTKEIELANEQILAFTEENIRLHATFQRVENELRTTRNHYSQMVREKDNLLKAYRRMEIMTGNVRDWIPALHDRNEKRRLEVEGQRRVHKELQDDMTKTKQDIDMCLYQYMKSEDVEKEEREHLAGLMTECHVLEEQHDEANQDVTELMKKADHMQMERTLRSRDLVKIQTRLRQIREEHRFKREEVFDAEKRYMELANRSKALFNLYDVVKTDRNKLLHMIQSSKLRLNEMQEKHRILAAEAEILQSDLSSKDKDLSKGRQELTNAVLQRDLLRAEANKLLVIYREKRDAVEQHVAQLELLQSSIESAERDMNHLKKQYQRMVTDRNQMAQTLLERSDELCVLQEKLNLQDEVLKNGELAVAERQEEIRRLEIEIQDTHRAIHVFRKLKPVVQGYDAEVAALKNDLESLKQKEVRLGDEVESPTARLGIARERHPRKNRYGVVVPPAHPEDFDLLKGKDPEPDRLADKINALSERLLHKEQQMLEKELIEREVTTLIERLQRQLSDSHDTALTKNSDKHELAQRIQKIERQMMSQVSELSIHQAAAMKLHQQKEALEAEFEDAKRKLAEGQAPTLDAEKDWFRFEYAQARQDQELVQRKEAWLRQAGGLGIDFAQVAKLPESGVNETAFFATKEGSLTAALPRPNAYLPDGLVSVSDERLAEVPIPRPYGQLAPFKPTDNVKMHRYVRKPQIKPIEF